MASKTSTTYYKATHPETGKWIVGETTLGIGQEIWRLVRGDDQSEFMLLLKDDPRKISWEILTKKEYETAVTELPPEPTPTPTPTPTPKATKAPKTPKAPKTAKVTKPAASPKPAPAPAPKVVETKKKRGKVAVELTSETDTLTFASISEVVRHLDGKVAKAKVTKMVSDPTFTVDGYSIRKVEG